MKKILAVFLIVASLVTLASCGNFYAPVESTEREASVVMTFEIDGVRYDMKYEMYRAFFLNFKSKVDGGDNSVWQGENKETYIAEIDEIIADAALEIFSVFALCRSSGISTSSTSFGKTVNNYINESIEEYESYDAYLAHLKENNANYSFQKLLIEYGVARALLEEDYIGVSAFEDFVGSTSGEIKYTEEEVKAFYDSEECVRVLRLLVAEKSRAEQLKERMAAASSDSAVAYIVGGNGLADGGEVENGFTLGKYNLNTQVYGDTASIAFATSIGGVSEVFRAGGLYSVIYRMNKNDEHFQNNKDEITFIYLSNKLGEMLHSKSESATPPKKTAFYDSIVHSLISMDDK